MPDGHPRSSHNEKTVGSPQLHKRIQQEARKTVILEKNKMISFLDLCKEIILVPRKDTKTFAKLSIYKMYYIKKMPDGLPLALHNEKPVGSPQLHKRIQ